MLRLTTPSDQNAANLIKRYDKEGCCGDEAQACQYSVVIPTANAVNGITIKVNGENKEITTGFPATGAANVVTAIKAALASAGYENDDETPTGVQSETAVANTIYRITGTVEVVSMRHNTSTSVSATKLCNRVKKCQFTLAWAGSASATTVTINGNAQSLAAQVYADKTAQQVRDAIVALSNFPSTATIDVVKADNLFTITVTDVFTASYAFGASAFAKSNCGMGYTA